MSREGLRHLADVDRQEEERDEQRRDRGLRVPRDLAHGPTAEQQDLGHAACSSSPALPRRPRAGARSPAGTRRRATAARRRSRPTRISAAVEPPHDLGDRARAVLHVERERVGLGDDPLEPRAARRSRASTRVASAPSSSTVTTSWPICAFRLAGVPSATILPASMIATRSQSWSASSMYWVVRKTVVPVALIRRTSSQTASREAGSSPVVGSSRNSTSGRMDERARQVEAPLHAARVGLGAPVGGLAQPDELEQLLRARLSVGALDAVQAALQLEQLAAGLDGIEPDLLERDADAPPHLGRVGDHVDGPRRWRSRWSAAAACTASCTVVVLPAPFGPRKPKTSPRLMFRSMSRTASTPPLNVRRSERTSTA